MYVKFKTVIFLKISKLQLKTLYSKMAALLFCKKVKIAKKRKI